MSSYPSLPSAEQRLLVRTVNIALLVNNMQETADKVAGLAVRLGGFLVSSEIDQETQRAGVSIRVPSDRTDEALSELRGMAVRVTAEKQESQDVTEEYVDLQAHLHNLQATEAQLLSIMKEARTVSDTLLVQRELTSVRAEIERRKGRIQYLERTSSTSLITASLSVPGSQKPLVERGWSLVETLKDAFRALIIAGEVLLALVVWVILFIPIWVPIAVLVYYLRRRRRRVARPPQPVAPAAQ